MGMIIWKKMEKLAHQCFEGELTMPRIWFWMIGAICFLTGVIYGLLKAPLSHGVMIGSNNGNQTNCGWGRPDADEDPNGQNTTAGKAEKNKSEK